MSLILANDIIVPNDWHGVTADDVLTQRAENERIKVIGNISISRDIKAQLMQLQSHIETGAIVGIKMYPGYENFDSTDKRLMPVYEFCQKLHVPVILHTGFLLQGSSVFKNKLILTVLARLLHFFPRSP